MTVTLSVGIDTDTTVTVSTDQSIPVVTIGKDIYVMCRSPKAVADLAHAFATAAMHLHAGEQAALVEQLLGES